MSDALVSVTDLQKYYFERDSLVDRLLGRDPRAVKAVDGVSFEIREGETLGLVGESGCGKSTAGETLLNLRGATDGSVYFDGTDVYAMDDDEMSDFRERAGIVFQDPLSSLNPRMTVGRLVREPLDVHDVGSKADRRERVDTLLERVGLSADQRDRYPHEFSGGQQQRIAIARSLALEPDFLVLDEPVSALDVSVQAQILNLLDDLQSELGLTYLFIAHDLSVVRHISDRVAVMYLGEIAEIGPVEEIFDDPKHPYTEALLESVPRAEVAEYDRDVEVLEGDVPSPRDPPSGCRFRTRCPKVIPPDGVDVAQSVYRDVMDLRERIESGEADPEEARRALGRDGGEATESGAAAAEGERVDAAETTVAAGVLDSVAGENAATVEESLDRLADGDREAAAETLRERFESVCERETPVLAESDGHPASCHLHGRPDGERTD